MSIVEHMSRYQDRLVTLRRDIHANPELAFDVQRTANIVARELARIGVVVHTGIGGSGVVGVLKKGDSPRSIGLRADMDALPIHEETQLAYQSKVPQRMHACGHDGHTAFLLCAAEYLAETGHFDGTVHFIFQPAEEVFGGAKAMIEDGLFDRFPCQSIFGVHNRPGLEVGKYRIRPGAMMAGGAFFSITVTGRGSHGARPEESVDPVLTVAHIAIALQSIVSRNISPAEAAVLSVTKISGGDAFNVIPKTAELDGTVRAFSSETIDAIEERLTAIANSVAAAFGATAEVDFQVLVSPVVNDPKETEEMVQSAVELVGAGNVSASGPALMASEDFCYMLERCPGAFINVGIASGNVGTEPLHTPGYDFNEAAIPYGAALYARIVERKLAA